MGYAENVFLNCPFDGAYEPLLQALVFAVQACGFVPRSALELDDGSEVRIGKIVRIIAESRYGIHDLSRTELDTGSHLPRFNMPLELGLFLGAKYYGDPHQGQKAAIIFDIERYRYQMFCSDIAGQDIRAHHGREEELIRHVRDALATWRREASIPSGSVIHERYARFKRRLSRIATRAGLRVPELTFNDLTRLIRGWLVNEAD
ncbi:MAG: hypothetical protein ACJ8GN_08325 [Longimicrobiaceae bacterium]